MNRLPNRRSRRSRFTESSLTSCPSWRLDHLLFLRRRWLRPCFSRRSLPLPVTLKRFGVDLCVFIFGSDTPFQLFVVGSGKLSLPLLVFGVLADHVYRTLALDDLALGDDA